MDSVFQRFYYTVNRFCIVYQLLLTTFELSNANELCYIKNLKLYYYENRNTKNSKQRSKKSNF
jgi:hypothetical protein